MQAKKTTLRDLVIEAFTLAGRDLTVEELSTAIYMTHVNYANITNGMLTETVFYKNSDSFVTVEGLDASLEQLVKDGVLKEEPAVVYDNQATIEDVELDCACDKETNGNLPLYIMTPNGVPVPVLIDDLSHLFAVTGPTEYDGVKIPKHVMIKPPSFEDEAGLFDHYYGKSK